MTLETFLDHLEKPRRNGRGFLACCPAHDDRSPSLSISEGDDRRILLRCWAGCTAGEIVSALGLTLSDLFGGTQTREARNHRHRIKSISSQTQQAGFCRAALYRRADVVLEALKKVEKSSLSQDEKNRISHIGINAFAILNEEIRHERRIAWSRRRIRRNEDRGIQLFKHTKRQVQNRL